MEHNIIYSKKESDARILLNIKHKKKEKSVDFNQI